MKELYCLHLSILKRLVCFCVMNPVSILTQLAFFFFLQNWILNNESNILSVTGSEAMAKSV